ncbi:hypothetical protein ACFSX9_07030 [Flavobacterium ardleyense]|uniref:Lipoprotein n=1 Tax=Flavobacterium ardleyense TaxID=2038737 RepID=A0ABW5Z7N1_9FLAO
MKNSTKLLGLFAVSFFLFSCSADEQDADLDRAIKLSEMIQLNTMESKTENDSSAREEGTPVIIIKKE